MASELSNYLANAILAWHKGTDMPEAPAVVYLGLFNGNPTGTGSGGTEVTTSIRAAGRVAVTFGSVTSRAVTNSAAIDFGASDGDVTVTHAALFDAASGGNMLSYSPLNASRAIVTGANVSVPIDVGNLNFN